MSRGQGAGGGVSLLPSALADGSRRWLLQTRALATLNNIQPQRTPSISVVRRYICVAIQALGWHASWVTTSRK